MALEYPEIGSVFYYLTTLKNIRHRNRKGLLCQCKCGVKTKVCLYDVLKGKTKSCGCRQIDLPPNKKHGHSKGIEYPPYKHMISRCYDPKNDEYKNYGGRGISVCKRWRDSIDNFISDMGKRPSLKYSIDRYPNQNGNYEPSNCRWATMTQQGRNRRNNTILEVNGVKKCVSEWAEFSNINVRTIFSRLSEGWSQEKAVLTPKMTRSEIYQKTLVNWQKPIVLPKANFTETIKHSSKKKKK